MNKKIAYIRTPNTDETLKIAGFIDEHRLLKPYFEKLGGDLIAVDWRDAGVDWKIFDFIIPKNIWNYFEHYSEFKKWLAQRTGEGVAFRNSAETLLWNSNKKYLDEIQKSGGSVAPLTFIEDPNHLEAVDFLFDVNERLVLKPAVSGGGRKTGVYLRQERSAFLDDARQILQECPIVVQPFLHQIAEGELSFFFFGDCFSHAIVKKPKSGDFRAHSLFGAKNSAIQPTLAQIDEALAFLQYAPHKAYYARVDGLYVEGRLQLIELELIEPYLYFEYAAESACQKFAEALMS